MVDITQATDADIRQNVDAFSAALQSKQVSLPSIGLRRILLAVDESNQGETAERLAASLARTHDARVVLLYAYEGVRDEARETYLSARARALESAGISLEPLDEPVRTEHGLRSFEQILETSEKKQVNLLVTPAPYLDDYTRLGEESVGANLDVLMARSRVPLLVVRKPGVDPKTCFGNSLLAITPYVRATVDAAAWMLKLAGSGATLRLLAFLEHGGTQGAAEEARDVDVALMDAEKLAGLRRPELAGLIAELQRRTAETHSACRLVVRGGDPLEGTRDMVNAEEGLLVLASDPQPFVHARNLALVRCSKNPVLLVGAG